MDNTITCPVSGDQIGPGEGVAARDSKGNIWIVSSEVEAADPQGCVHSGDASRAQADHRAGRLMTSQKDLVLASLIREPDPKK